MYRGCMCVYISVKLPIGQLLVQSICWLKENILPPDGVVCDPSGKPLQSHIFCCLVTTNLFVCVSNIPLKELYQLCFKI